MYLMSCAAPRPPLPCVHVHPAHPYPQHRRVLHLPPRALRAHRRPSAPVHLAQSGTALRRRTKRVAGAVPAHRRTPRRSATTATRWPPALESHAQRITALLLAGERIGAASSPASQRHDFQHVDVDSLELIRPRSVGVEHVGLWAMDQLGLRTRLEALGIGASVRTAAIGSIIARMVRPSSERAHPGRTPERGLRDDGADVNRPGNPGDYTC